MATFFRLEVSRSEALQQIQQKLAQADNRELGEVLWILDTDNIASNYTVTDDDITTNVTTGD